MFGSNMLVYYKYIMQADYDLKAESLFLLHFSPFFVTVLTYALYDNPPPFISIFFYLCIFLGILA